jgi:aryl-alcohol dehydrogenase-like predicted oxidoreductase
MLTGKYTTETIFVDDDFRSTWPREYFLMQVQLTEKLRRLEHPGQRTLAQTALRFVLDESAVSVTIPGIKTPQQARENLAVSDLSALSEDERQTITECMESMMDDLL